MIREIPDLGRIMALVPEDAPGTGDVSTGAATAPRDHLAAKHYDHAVDRSAEEDNPAAPGWIEAIGRVWLAEIAALREEQRVLVARIDAELARSGTSRSSTVTAPFSLES